MSRTFALTTPTRRSKRLLENGYYRPQSTDVMEMLDVSASDEDDTTSIDSNLSKLSYSSEHRKIMYRESPLRAFGFRRRQHSHSPIRHAATSTLDLSLQHKYDSNATNANQLHHSSSQKNISYASSGSIEKYESVIAGSHSDTFLSQSRHFNSCLTTNEFVSKQSGSAFNQQKSTLYDEAGTGDNFKVPLLKNRYISSSRSRIKIQDQSTDYLLSDEDFEESECAETTVKDLKWYSSFVYLICFCTSILIGVIHKIGRLFYQAAILLLVFDTWFLSSTVQISCVLKKVFKKVAFIFALLLLVFFLYSYLPRSLKIVDQAASDVDLSSHPSEEVNPVLSSKFYSPSNPQEDSFQVNDAHGALQKLELNLKEYERQASERYTFLLNLIQEMKKNSEKDKQDLPVYEKELIEKMQTIISKSTEMEILKSNEILDQKIKLLQVELLSLQQNNSGNMKLLREIHDKVESNKNMNEPYINRFKQVEQEFINSKSKLDALIEEHKVLKTSVDSRSGNLTYLRHISNQQFIVNFQALLEDQSESSTMKQQSSEKRRLTYLMRIFMSWIERKGFVREEALEKLRNEAAANSTRIENYFYKAMDNTINEFKKISFKQSSTERDTDVPSSVQSSPALTEHLIKTWIKEALDLYSADRVGEADFALESAGGSIINTRCSETFKHKTALVSILGIPIYYNINTPRSIIQPSIMPGDCWAFQGSKGFIVISLSAKIKPTSFTIDHIPKSLSLTDSISSAPKDFSVFGLEYASDANGVLLGTFRFENEGEPIQRFFVTDDSDIEVDHVELRITSNWGHPLFTCLYRFRVHGQRI